MFVRWCVGRKNILNSSSSKFAFKKETFNQFIVFGLQFFEVPVVSHCPSTLTLWFALDGKLNMVLPIFLGKHLVSKVFCPE